MTVTVADETLVEKVLSGDLEGFGELHRRYFPRVVRLVMGVVKDRSLAEDTAQEAYLSALKALPRLENPNRFYPWLCRIAVNRAIEHKRQHSRRERLTPTAFDEEGKAVAEEAPGRGPSALDRLLHEERADRLQRALDRLPEKQRAAVLLRFFDELPMRNVAEILGCGEITARTQVFRGLRKLGTYLRPSSAARGME